MLTELQPFATFVNFFTLKSCLIARYLENYLSYDIDIWYTDWGWGVDYLINF